MRSPVLCVVCGVALFACVAPMSGCQSGGMSGLFGKDAMALLSPYLKDAANSYLTNINSLVDSLGKVQSLSDAVAIAPKVEPAAKDAKKAYDVMAAASPEERKLLWDAFGPKFESSNSGFTSQLSRVKGDSLWGQAVGSALEQVKLYSGK